MEKALKLLLDHQKTNNYRSLYSALKIIIHGQRKNPKGADPLVRALSFTVLEPLLVEIEQNLLEGKKEVESFQELVKKKEEKSSEVIFVDFNKRKVKKRKIVKAA